MIAQSRPATAAAGAARLTTASRGKNPEPVRAGAFRMAALAALVAALAGAAALIAAHAQIERTRLDHLAAVGELARVSLQGQIARAESDLVAIAADPRTAQALEERDAGARTWLVQQAKRSGFAELLLVESGSGRVAVRSAGDAAQAIDPSSELGRSIGKAWRSSKPGLVELIDAGASEGEERPALWAATGVFVGRRAVGGLVAGLPTTLITAKGAAGASAGAAPMWIGPDKKPRGAATGPSGRAKPDAASPGIHEAIGGAHGVGRYQVAGQSVLGAYAPLAVDGLGWVVAVEEPRSNALTALGPLIPLLGLVALCASGLGWLIGGRLWRRFAGRLRQLSDVVQKAQRGDRRARLDVKQSGAVGELAASINRLLDDRAQLAERAEQDTQRISREVEAMAGVVAAARGGDTTARAVASGPLAGAAKGLNELLDQLGDLGRALEETTSRIGASSNEARELADRAATEAAGQARDAAAVVTSTHAMRDGVAQLAGQCGEALERARRGEQAGRQGDSAVADVAGGLDGLQRETRSATVKIKRLGERSMQMSAIIGSISKMAAQTDMLALNAAIEASRAGEQGQGFTVVAEEVRKLAERAVAATKEVERLIAGIQSDVGEAVSGMERQVERLDLQIAASEEARRALERVHASTEETATLIEQIAGAADEQGRSADTLGAALGKLVDTARGVQQTSDQAKRSVRQLKTISEELDARARQFQA